MQIFHYMTIIVSWKLCVWDITAGFHVLAPTHFKNDCIWKIGNVWFFIGKWVFYNQVNISAMCKYWRQSTSPCYSFHGTAVNLTALEWRPFFWESIEKTSDGQRVTRYKGCDGLLLTAIYSRLNFTPTFIPVNKWLEVRFFFHTTKCIIINLSTLPRRMVS